MRFTYGGQRQFGAAAAVAGPGNGAGSPGGVVRELSAEELRTLLARSGHAPWYVLPIALVTILVAVCIALVAFVVAIPVFVITFAVTLAARAVARGQRDRQPATPAGA